MKTQLCKLINYLRENDYTFVLNSVGYSFNIQIEVSGYNDLIVESCDENRLFKIQGRAFEHKYDSYKGIVLWLTEMKDNK